MSLDQVYDSDKAVNQQRCWLNEVVNGQQNDWEGKQERDCLRGVATKTYLPTYNVCTQPMPQCDQLELMGLTIPTADAPQPQFAKRMAECSAPVCQGPDLATLRQLSCSGPYGRNTYAVSRGGAGAGNFALPGSASSVVSSFVWVIILIVFLVALLGIGYLLFRR